MSYRSWLKDVKHMQDLGSHVYSTNQDWQTQEKRDNMYYELRKNPVEGLKGVSQHFYGIHRGARILEFKREDRESSITLEDWWLPDFLYHVATLANVAVPEIDSRVTIQFHDVAYQTTLAARPDGVVRFYRYDQPSEHDRIYRDWFHRQDNRLQWVAQVDAYGKERGTLTVGPFIVVDCASVSVADDREIVLRSSFSPLLVDLWKHYWSGSLVSKLADPLNGPRAFAEFLEQRGASVSELFQS